MNIVLFKNNRFYKYKNRAVFLQIANFLYKHFNFPEDSLLSIILTNERDMEKINNEFLKHEGTTDVITFDYQEQQIEEIGEIYICLEVVEQQAKDFSNSFDKELLLYLVHGMLHLIGLEDKAEEEKIVMRAAEREIIQLIEQNFDNLAVLC